MSTIDHSQRTAARIAWVSSLVAMAIVVFGNYRLLSPFLAVILKPVKEIGMGPTRPIS